MRVPIRKPGKYTHAKADWHVTAAKLKELRAKLKHLKAEAQPQAMAEVMHLADTGTTQRMLGTRQLRGTYAA